MSMLDSDGWVMAYEDGLHSLISVDSDPCLDSSVAMVLTKSL